MSGLSTTREVDSGGSGPASLRSLKFRVIFAWNSVSAGFPVLGGMSNQMAWRILPNFKIITFTHTVEAYRFYLVCDLGDSTRLITYDVLRHQHAQCSRNVSCLYPLRTHHFCRGQHPTAGTSHAPLSPGTGQAAGPGSECHQKQPLANDERKREDK